MPRAQQKSGYRVDILLLLTRTFAPYAGSKKEPLSLEFAESLSRGLKRQNAAGRLLAVPEEKIIEEW